MPRFVVLYPPPVDEVAFEKAFVEEHVPLVLAQIATVQRAIGARVVTSLRGERPYHWLEELYFDTIDDLTSGTQSPGGQRAMGHALQISTGGAPTMLVVDDPG